MVKFSNEIEWGVRQPHHIFYSYGKRMKIEKESMFTVELSVGPFKDVNVLNEEVQKGVNVLTNALSVYGGGSVMPNQRQRIQLLQQLEHSAEVGTKVAAQFSLITSFQQVIGIKRGQEQKGIALYKALNGLADVYAILAAHSPKVWVISEKGLELKEDNMNVARLSHAYATIYHILPPPYLTLFKPFHHNPKQELLTRLKNVLSYEMANVVRNNVYVQLITQAITTNAAWKWQYGPVALRGDHANEEDAFSVEIRVMDNPHPNPSLSLSYIEIINLITAHNLPFFINNHKKLWKRWTNCVKRCNNHYPFLYYLYNQPQETLELARVLINNTPLNTQQKELIEEKINNFKERAQITL